MASKREWDFIYRRIEFRSDNRSARFERGCYIVLTGTATCAVWEPVSGYWFTDMATWAACLEPNVVLCSYPAVLRVCVGGFAAAAAERIGRW